MFISILKRLILFILLPNAFIIYSFFLNDFFNFDLFNHHKMALLNTKLTSLEKTIESQENYIDKNTNDNNKLLVYIFGSLLIAGCLYFGSNSFDNGSGPDTASIVKTIVETNASNSKNIINEVRNVSTTLVEHQNETTSSLLSRLINIQHQNLNSTINTIVDTSVSVEDQVNAVNDDLQDAIEDQNSFLNKSFQDLQSFFIHSVENINIYVSQNVELKLINLEYKINFLIEKLEKIASLLDFTSSFEKEQTDITLYFQDESPVLSDEVKEASLEAKKPTT